MDDSEREHITDDADNEFPPPRRPVRPTAIIGIIVLVALLVAGGFFTATRFIGGNSAAVPTPTLAPGSNLFYIQVSPNWGNVYIDGQKLARLPDPNVDPPLQLSPGVHEVSWQADPFTQHCIIVVPPQSGETPCLANDILTVPVGPNKGLSAFVITFTASFANLPTAEQQSLTQAAQIALNALQSSDTVQPGELYADEHPPQFVATATSPLHATLHFQLDTNSNSPGQCAGAVLGFGFGTTCNYNGQNCHTFCTVTEPAELKVPPGRWDVLGIMLPTWTYTTPGGQVVAQNQPDETDNSGTEYEVPLSITRTAGQWHVATSIPGNPTASLSGGPSCETAYVIVNDDPTGTYTTVALPGNPYQSLAWNASYGSNPAAGCLLTAYPIYTNGPTSSQSIARCLYRFGVLLALDTATHKFWPNLPLADAYEQSIAQHIPL